MAIFIIKFYLLIKEYERCFITIINLNIALVNKMQKKNRPDKAG